MDKSSNTPSKSATPRREPAPNLVDQVVALRQQGLGTDAIADQCAYCGTYEVGISPCFEL